MVIFQTEWPSSIFLTVVRLHQLELRVVNLALSRPVEMHPTVIIQTKRHSSMPIPTVLRLYQPELRVSNLALPSMTLH
jgi:hypothetical protein